MDFGSLLYTAHKNDKSANKEVKCYKTKFDPPKKEAKPKTINLSANIQKYLQKREDEERRKAEDEKRKKEELLALRSQDRKAFKRVQTMLKRTKSANKSVMEDAIDEVNTADTMNGPQQCDEDDYGYVSQEASAFYAKMMDKYASMPPEEPKFSQSKKPVIKDLNAAKDRVRAALQREEEEEMMPHKRKRKSKGDKLADENGDEEEEEKRDRSRDPSPEEEPKPKKIKKLAPPPIDFSSLLKLAEQKQFEPVKIEKKMDDDERPMTKRQKLEYERELESKRRREEREAMRHAALNKNSKMSGAGDKREKPNSLGRIPKKSDTPDSKPKPGGKPPAEIRQKNSIDSDDGQYKNSYNSDNDRPKSKYSSDMDRPRNICDKNEDGRKETSILKASLLRTDDRKPLKPRQPSIAANKMKSRRHSVSDEEQSEVSDSSYNKSDRHSNHNRQEKPSKPEYRKLPSKESGGYSERNGYNKRLSNTDNECSDSQSGGDSKMYHSSKQQLYSGTSNHKYKPELKYRSETEKSSYYQKQPPKKHQHSIGRERSYSPENNKCFSNRRQSYSESEPEDESKYKPSKIERPQPKKSYYEKTVESEDGRSQSPVGSKYDRQRKDSLSEPESEYDTRHEPSHKKHSSTKFKKISSLFEGSDEEQSSYHDKNRMHKESENRKPKTSIGSDRQKHISTDSKFKIPKTGSKSDLDRTKMSEKADRYKPLENSRPLSSDSKSSNRDSSKQHVENLKSERSVPNYKPDSDKVRSGVDKNRDKPRSTELSKTEMSKDSIKKPSQSAEDILKKSANVWSKPCNLSPSNSGPRGPNTLSESQLQRLREMNKKPTPSKPVEDRFRSGSSENKISVSGRPSPRDERKSDGRSAPPRPGGGLQGKQSLLMKAAAERGAMMKAKIATSRSSDQERQSSRPPVDQKSVSKQSSSSTPNKSREPQTKDSRPKQVEVKPKQFPPSDLKPRQFPPSDLKPRQFPPSDLKPRQFPPNDLRPKQFPPKDIRPRQFPPPDVKRKLKPRRIEDDSDEEYDSEMDSFIDDGSDLNQEEISREIQAIFGYDKSRYAGLDDDDECMESNFGQIDKEELMSLKIGAKEDYEELMKDLARKKRAKQRKQMERMGSRR